VQGLIGVDTGHRDSVPLRARMCRSRVFSPGCLEVRRAGCGKTEP
jgi:hypothetical protein